MLPNIDSFIVKVNIKYEAEKTHLYQKQEFKKIDGQVDFVMHFSLLST